ncbi:hypothetical protein [Paraclostridium sordellii]|uniref:hypothetical protein n=1 Tax=Paraclostridium sordellii TaxID=1505 RepID=UPI00189C0F62|nr:hypothetical protein [Paeniclostridium sordellii]
MNFKKIFKKAFPYALIVGCILTTYTSTSNAGANILHYKKYFFISKIGYTFTDIKRKTSSNAVCNNDWIDGASYHTAVLVNGDNKIRSTTEKVYEGTREVLYTSTNDGTRAAAGYYYRQKHVSPKIGVTTSGTFSVDNKQDF